MNRLFEQLYAHPWTNINEYIAAYGLQPKSPIQEKISSIKDWYNRISFLIQKYFLHCPYTFEQGWSIFVLTM